MSKKHTKPERQDDRIMVGISRKLHAEIKQRAELERRNIRVLMEELLADGLKRRFVPVTDFVNT